jgi:dCTP deaminase
MILSDREIRSALSRGALRITPDPPAEAWSSTALDLRLSSDIILWKKPKVAGVEVPVSPFNPEYDFAALLRDHSEKVVIPPAGFVMKSGSFLLGWTIEKIWLPHRSRLAARVEGKSSLARLGIGVHVTAPTIHAGFGYKKDDENYPGSPLQLEIWNVGPLDVSLEADKAICQLIFEIVDGTPDKGYEGRFSIQGPAIPSTS